MNRTKRFSATQLAVVMLALLLLVQAPSLFAGDEYGWVCHKPGTPAEQSKYLPIEAHGNKDVNGHLGHGDTEGKCASDQEPTPTPVSPTETPVSPTATPVPPTATPVPPTATPTQKPTSTPVSTQVPPPTETPWIPVTSTPASQPVSTASSAPASCDPYDGCDSCAVVREALAQGKLILIVDVDEMRIFDGTVEIHLQD